MSTIELAVRRLALVSPPVSAAHAAEAIRKVSGFKPRTSPPLAPEPALPQRLPAPAWADPTQTARAHALRAFSMVALSALAGAGLVLAVLALQARPLAQNATVLPVNPQAPAPALAVAERVRDVTFDAPPAQVQRPAPTMPVSATSVAAEPATATQAAILADTRQAGEAVTAWARAWSERDAGRYLGFYAGEFIPDRGLSRSAWESQRRKRLQAPSAISVIIRDLRLEPLTADRMIARFTQDYAADNYREAGTRKMLVLVREPAGWRIAVEALEATPARAG